jgi:Domain of unknown function (DUF4105)
MTNQILRWIKRRPWTSIALAVLALAIVGEASVLFEKPRLDRKWVENLAVMPTILLKQDGFSLTKATDWAYDAKGPTQKTYTSASESFADLKNVWFMVEPHPGLKPMAHTLVMFEFADDRMIGLTIEARREENEKYDALAGAFNAFELAYIWSTPKDLLTRRVVLLGHDVLMYPLLLSADQKQAFLKALLEKTISVSTTPRFYNTLTSNCTNELAKTAGLSWTYEFVLTGYSAERLYALKMIPGESFEAARARALITGKVRQWNGLSTLDFNRALLAELRTRSAATSSIATRAP